MDRYGVCTLCVSFFSILLFCFVVRWLTWTIFSVFSDTINVRFIDKDTSKKKIKALTKIGEKKVLLRKSFPAESFDFVLFVMCNYLLHFYNFPKPNGRQDLSYHAMKLITKFIIKHELNNCCFCYYYYYCYQWALNPFWNRFYISQFLFSVIYIIKIIIMFVSKTFSDTSNSNKSCSFHNSYHPAA